MITEVEALTIIARYADARGEFADEIRVLGEFIQQQKEAIQRAEMGAGWIREAVIQVRDTAGDDWTKRILNRILNTMPTGGEIVEQFRLINLQHQRYHNILDNAFFALDLALGTFDWQAQNGDGQAVKTADIIRNVQNQIRMVKVFDEQPSEELDAQRHS